MSDGEWTEVLILIRELWPAWKPTDRQFEAFELVARPLDATSFSESLRRHWPESPAFPKVERILALSTLIAYDRAAETTGGAETASRAMDEIDTDDHVARMLLASLPADTLERAKRIALDRAAGWTQRRYADADPANPPRYLARLMADVAASEGARLPKDETTTRGEVSRPLPLSR